MTTYGPRDYLEPTTTVEGEYPHVREVTRHPAFGMVAASRVSGKSNLFGSHVGHDGFIKLTVKRGYVSSDLGRDWYHAREQLIEISLSEAQWVGLVSRMNIGEGVPCTINWTEKDGYMPNISAVEKAAEKLNKDIEQVIRDNERDAAEAIAALREVLKKLPKKDYADALGRVERINEQGARNRLFHAKQLNEMSEKLVTEAKIEIDAMLDGAVNKFGLESIQQLSQLMAADPTTAIKLLGKNED